MRFLIAGSKSFDNYSLLCRRMDRYVETFAPTAVICGMARGADLLGKRWADERDIPVIEMPAQWEVGGKIDRGAGYKRNVEMAKITDMAFLFWDGVSHGTKHMLELLHGKPSVIEFFGKEL